MKLATPESRKLAGVPGSSERPVVSRPPPGLRSSSAIFGSAVVALAGTLLIWSRFANLGTSMWNDEAYTALQYADGGPHAIFSSSHYVPNNHVLFSVLAWMTANAIGRFEAAYRIWSVVPGVAAVALVAWWTWRRFSATTAVFVVVLATMSETHRVLVPQARGYGLAMFAGAVMLIGATEATRGTWRGGVPVFAAGGLLGICTLPVFVVGFTFQAIVVLVYRRVRGLAIAACVVVAVVVAVFYAPLVRGIHANAHQKVGEQLSAVGWLTEPYRQIAKPMLTPFLPHASASDAIAFVVFAGLVVLAVVCTVRDQPALVATLVVPVLGSYAVLAVARLYVEARFMSFLLFHVVVLLAIGASEAWTTVSRWRPVRFVALALALVLFAIGTHDVVRETRQQAQRPWENFKMVGELIEATHPRVVVTNNLAWSLEYYAGSRRVLVMQPAELRSGRFCFIPGPFMFVAQQGWGAVQPDVACLRARHAIKIDVPQQVEPPIGGRGAITVWAVPPS